MEEEKVLVEEERFLIDVTSLKDVTINNSIRLLQISFLPLLLLILISILIVVHIVQSQS